MSESPTGAGPQAAPAPAFPWRAALLLCLIAVLLRIATNLSRVDEHYPEGLMRGAVAESWIEGVPVWPWHAPQIPYLRGSIVVSAMAVPCFLVFGPTTFAVRLPGLLFHVAGLLVLMALAHRQYGRRAALIAGGLFALAPPSIAKIAVLSYGDHIESVPFILGAALLLLKWLDAPDARRTRLAFGLGLVAGLGIFWHPQARLGVLAVGLSGVLLSPRILLRRDTWTGLLPGLIVGLVPMALADWYTGYFGLAVMDQSADKLAGSLLSTATLGKWWRFWTVDLAHSLQYPWVAVGGATMALSGACALGLLVRAARGGAAGLLALWRRSAPLIVYVAAFSAVYAASRFQIQHELDSAILVRYVLPVVPVLLLPIAVAGGLLWDRGRRGAAALVAGLPLLAGGWGSLSTIDVDSMLHEPARSAVFWESAGAHLAYASLTEAQRAELRRLELSLYGDPTQDAQASAWVAGAADPARLLALIEKLDRSPPALRPLVYQIGLPMLNVVAPRNAAGGVAQMPRTLNALPAEWRPFALAQAGRALGSEPNLRPDAVDALAHACRDPAEEALLAGGIGDGIGSIGLPRFFKGGMLVARLTALSPTVALPHVAFGFGLHTGRLIHAFYPPADLLARTFLERTEPALWPEFARGLGAGYRSRFLQPPARDLDAPGVRRILALLAEKDAALEAPFRDGLSGQVTP